MQKPISIGVDIGGSHITCAAVKMLEGELLTDTLSRSTYHHEAPAGFILERWAEALNHTLSFVDDRQLAGIGFAIPGPFEYRNGVSRMEHKFKNLYGLHLPSALNPLLHFEGELPMRFLNDATSFAVGEAWLGEGQGYERVVVITLGTGFGSAFIQQGVPVVSGPKVPKEGCLWHLPFKDGIADDYFSTRWFLKAYENSSGKKAEGVKELMEMAATEARVLELFSEFGHNLANCLSGPLRQFDAQILIIGGNIAHALPLFGDAFRQGLDLEGLTLKVSMSRHMEHAALIGSARLLDDGFWEKVSRELPHL